jgi:uncharacterized protein
MAATRALCEAVSRTPRKSAFGDWKLSRYTHIIPSTIGGVVYNGRTGAVAEFSADGFSAIQQLLGTIGKPDSHPRRPSSSVAELFRQFQVGGFIVPSAEDEIASLEAQYELERQRSQFLFTILPTFACNLGCDYCFVGKKKGVMDAETQDRLIDFARKTIELKSPPSMFVDWFGGEPLLAPVIIERLSNAFIQICDEHNVAYRAQVITNGTRLDSHVAAMLERSRVNRIQITLDGPPSIHDIRRPYHSGSGSSFVHIIEALSRILGRFTIRLRINVDNGNLHSVWPLLDLFESKRWIGPDTNFYPYLARISAFTEACAGFAKQVTTLEDFFEVQFRWMERLRDLGVAVEEQGLYQFPEPKLYNCGAVGHNGFVFTPDGEIHKCGLEVDDSSRAIGRLSAPLRNDSPQRERFSKYSPFENQVCRECEFLPTCLGGCPRDRIEDHVVEVKNNCEFHKRFERDLLMFHLGYRPSATEAPHLAPSNESTALFPIIQ